MEEDSRRLRKVLLLFFLFCGFNSAGSVTGSKTEDSVSAAAYPAEQKPQSPDPERFLIKTSVTMVTTDVTVVGPDIADLRREDFVIYDNDVPHQVNLFSRNQLPLAVALLIDTSLSVEPYLPIIQISAGSALRNLKPDDQVVLFSFDSRSRRHSELTHDRVEIAEKISRLEFEIGTDIYNTIIDAAEYLQENAPGHRRAIIMISDNFFYGTGFSSSGFGDAEKARVTALESAVTLYSIKTPSTMNDTTGSAPRVKRIANETGGGIVALEGWTSLQEALEEVILKLRKQYTLGFNPSKLDEDGSFHKLQVEFSDKNRCADCRIFARVGYYAGIPSPIPAQEVKAEEPKRSQAETDRLLIQQSIVTAGTHGSADDLTDLPVEVRTARHTDPNGQENLDIKLKIDAEKIKFKMVDGRYACRLHIGVFYPNEKKKIVGSIEIIGGKFKESLYKAARVQGIMHSTMIPIMTEKPVIRVVVYDEQSDRVGSRMIRLQH